MVFQLDLDRYGFPIENVKEIVTRPSITRVPNAAEHIKGVINLRGKIVPVVDLRLKLGMEWREYDQSTCYVILEVVHEKNTVLVGIAVDTVHSASTFFDDNLPISTELTGRESSGVVRFLASDENGTVKILSIEALFEGQFYVSLQALN